MQELIDAVSAGHKAACLFVVQRGDCSRFAPCHAKDPVYSQLLKKAAESGVQLIAASCELRPTADGAQVYFNGLIPIDLDYKVSA